MRNDVCRAIEKMCILNFYYDGFKREVEPHACGNDSKGNDVMRAYQVSGGSESNEYTGWKLFEISKMNYLELTAMKFSGPRPGYKRDDKAMRRIYCQL